MEMKVLKALEQDAVSAAMQWATTGEGYSKMVDAVRKFLDARNGNYRRDGNNSEFILLRRFHTVQWIMVNCMFELTSEQEKRLHDTLMAIVEDDTHDNECSTKTM